MLNSLLRPGPFHGADLLLAQLVLLVEGFQRLLVNVALRSYMELRD